MGTIRLNGASVGDAPTNKRNSRRISWQYVEAPNYSADIEIYFIPQSQLHSAVIQNSSTADTGRFRIRVHDGADQLIHGGCVYQFAFPRSGTRSDYTPVSYTALVARTPTDRDRPGAEIWLRDRSPGIGFDHTPSIQRDWTDAGLRNHFADCREWNVASTRLTN